MILRYFLLVWVFPGAFGLIFPDDGFKAPPVESRPKFRYWIPDASVSTKDVRSDISDLAAVGSGGLELLPFYFYGNPSNSHTPTDWTHFGFGMEAFQHVFSQALQAAVDNELLFDFSLGANQGQGSPIKPGTDGLAVQLQLGVETVRSGTWFNGLVPGPQNLTDSLRSGGGFMHGLTSPEKGQLKAVIAGKVLSGLNETIVHPKLVYLDEASMIDLTHLVHNETLKWETPRGNGTWRLFTFWEGHTNQISCFNGENGTTPLEKGSYVVDHFSKVGAEIHTRSFESLVLNNESTKENLKSNGRYAWEDSMELLFTLPWTPEFLELFQAHHGYSLVKYLPLLFNKENSFNAASLPYTEEYSYGNYTKSGSSIHSVRFRQTLSQCYRDYLKYHTAWAHRLGIQYSAQPSYNLPLSFVNEVPSVDAPEGESLGFADIIDAYRTLSGPAQLANKSDISSECGAEFKPAYSQTIPELLKSVKKSYAGGLTMMVLHGMAYSGAYANTSWPGYQPFGYQTTDSWNRIQPAWKHMTDIIGFMGRTQHVLKTGVPRVDLAFFDSRTLWEASVIYNSDNLQKRGFTYNFVGPENLYLPSAFVTEGILASDGPGYQALIFLKNMAIGDETLSKIKEFDRSGLPVIFVGPQEHISSQVRKHKSPAAFDGLLKQGKNIHHVNSTSQLPDLLSHLGVKPRVYFAEPTDSVYSVQRADFTTGTEYTWFYNNGNASSSFIAEFSVPKDMKPFLLNAWNGEIIPLATYQLTSSGIRLSLTLNPDETIILAFAASETENTWVTDITGSVEEVKYTCDEQIMVNLKGPSKVVLSNGNIHNLNATVPSAANLSTWDIEIEDWHGDPDNTSSIETLITLHKFQGQPLKSWKDLSKILENVSGVGTYTTSFKVPDVPGIGAYLSVGPIFNTMRVWVNGNLLPSYPADNAKIDISDFISRGKENAIKIEVTTTLYNRLRADADSLLTIGMPLSMMAPTFADGERQNYGVLGPVTIDWVIGKKLDLE